MPIIQVQVLKGRSDEQIKRLIQGITEASVEHLEVRPEQVRVIVTEVADTHWGAGGETMVEVKKKRIATE